MIAGLTGIIGSGKSEVARILERLGAIVVDSDILAREVVKPQTEGLKQIVMEFGPQILTPQGELDRAKLGKIVFGDPLKRTSLEAIVHPKIRELHKQRIKEITAKAENRNSLIICVIPLLFETGSQYEELEKKIVVAASPENCIQRIIKRDNCTRDMAQKKLSSQMPISEKEKLADFVIRNDGSLEDLKRATEALYKKLTD